MRYFRYKNKEENPNNTFIEQYKALNTHEKRIIRKGKNWRRFSTVVSYIILIIVISAGLFPLELIPQPSGWIWKILVGIAKLVVGCAVFIAAGIAAVGSTMVLRKKAKSFHVPTMKKEILTKACRHLRDYYGLQEPYIITKCFDAADKKFRNHDVCIFVIEDELRITTDLIHGFLYEKRDLGCYAFAEQEIALSKRLCEKHLMCEIKTGETIFLLGYKAKKFIEKTS